MEWICAEEVTRGDNGWHPHLHLLCMPSTRVADPITTGGEWYEQWADLVERKLGAEHVPSLEHGLDLRPCTASRYISKLGLELTDAAAVKGRAPLALLEAGELSLYLELMHARTRARDITFSRGLADLRASLPASELEPAQLLQLRGSEWGRLRHADPLAPLAVAEQATAEEARAMAVWFIGELDDEPAELPIAAE